MQFIQVATLNGFDSKTPAIQSFVTSFEKVQIEKIRGN